MIAVRIHQFGGSDQVKLENIPEPTLKKGEALVRIHAAGVNPVDWMMREQIYIPEGVGKLPLTLGQDFAGTIEKIAEGSETTFRVGDPVFGETFGSFVEKATIPLQDLVRKPDKIDFETAASIPMTGLTAWQSIVETAQAGPGKRVLIHGAGGGVGSLAVQFAKLRGAWVAATASQVSLDWLRSIGVDLLINYKTERFEDLVRDIDVVLDPLGGEIQKRSWQVLKPNGMMINLIDEIQDSEKRYPTQKGIHFGMEYRVRDLEQIAGLIESGKVRIHLSQVLRLDQAREAMDINQQGHSHGKIVLKVA